MMKTNPWAWIPTLYFAEGLPNIIVTALSVFMYMQMGLSDADVALYAGWLCLPWVLKPLWSPFIDILKTKRWWILTMQMLIGGALAGYCLYVANSILVSRHNVLFLLHGFCQCHTRHSRRWLLHADA